MRTTQRFICMLLCAAGCVRAEDTTSLRTDVAAIQEQIKTAEADNAKYTGGLVKSIVVLRLEILRQTEAMLQQRLNASAYGISLTYTVDGKPFSQPPSAGELPRAVEQEIADNQAKITRQQAEVARYNGGLVQAVALSTLETLRQTQAMLDQRRLALKYGLPQYVSFQAQTETATPPAPVQPRAATPPLSDDRHLADEAKSKSDALASELQKTIELTVYEKGFIQSDASARRFRDYITLKCAYQNNSVKDIRAFRGKVRFTDLFGSEIFTTSLTISDPISAGQKGNWNGMIEYNQFIQPQQRLRNIQLKDMKVVWIPESVIFSDGSEVGASQ